MRTSRQDRGDAAEAQVARTLLNAGWTILGRQVHVGRAEVDLIGVDPGPPASLVFVEVRFRARRDFGLPEESVDHAKRARLHAAYFGLRDRGRLPSGVPLPALPVRFDLIVVEPTAVRHHRHAA